MRYFLPGILIYLISTNILFAQGYVDQAAIAPVINNQNGDVNGVWRATWHTYEYKDHVKDSIGIEGELLNHISSLPGVYTNERTYIVELANRITKDNIKKGRIIFIPDSFLTDYRAYSPYPFYYQKSDSFPKLFIIDKFTQTFAAYEYGKLVRWGLVSSGHKNSLTPAGRYNFNWKDEHRYSNAAPAGEVWEMFWVFNFQADWGIHVHQYHLPIGYAASHGCVRVSEADAKWNFVWANGWEYKNGKLLRNGTPVIVINDNPAQRPAHWAYTNSTVQSLVKLPEDLFALKAGTLNQVLYPWYSGW